MYTILVNDLHELVTSPNQNERIMQRSKLVDKIHFLVPPNYKGFDMTNTTVCLEYTKPVSREYKIELLTKSEQLYKEHLEYILPIDTELTKEAGSLELQLSFTTVTMNSNGEVKQHVRKTEPTYINIIPIANWSLEIPDDLLTPIDQRLIKLDMVAQQMADINMALADSIPDDIVMEEGRAYLSQNGKVMPNTIGIPIENCECETGVPVVDFSETKKEPDDGTVDNVVEF